MTEKEKFFEWFRKEKENGLVDIKFTPNYENIYNITEENLYAELNRMNEADEIGETEDLELFPSGKYEYL